MRALVGCEFSGVVRRALRAVGVDAWSCDLLPSEDDSPYHIQGDVLELLDEGWDLGIFHPPCTHLAVSGARHFKEKIADGRQQASLDFVQKLMDCKIPRTAIENPVSVISSKIRKPDQVIQPWQFGHTENKKTCLWLKNLPLLKETSNVRHIMAGMPKKETDKVHRMPPGVERWKMRSLTYQGIADAIADQWGRL